MGSPLNSESTNRQQKIFPSTEPPPIFSNDQSIDNLCFEGKEQLLNELRDAPVKIREEIKVLLNEFTDPSMFGATCFLKYCDQASQLQNFIRIIVELKHHNSENDTITRLLTNLESFLDKRFDLSKKAFAQKFLDIAKQGLIKKQTQMVFDDLPLLTEEQIRLRYERLMSHFSFDDDKETNKMFNKFQRKLTVVKERLVSTKMRNSSEFYEKRGKYHLKKDQFQKAYLEYKTACKLAVTTKMKIKFRLKMAKCLSSNEKTATDVSKMNEAIFFTLTAINLIYKEIQAEDKDRTKLLEKANTLYQSLNGTSQEAIIESKEVEGLLQEKMIQIYSLKTKMFDQYDNCLTSMIKQEIKQKITSLDDEEMLEKIESTINATEDGVDQLLKKYINIEKYRDDTVALFLNQIGERYIQKKKFGKAKNWLKGLIIHLCNKDINGDGGQDDKSEDVIESKLKDCLTTANLNIALCYLLGDNQTSSSSSSSDQIISSVKIIDCLSKISEIKHSSANRLNKSTQSKQQQRIPFNQSEQRLEIFESLLFLLGITPMSEIKMLEKKNAEIKTPSANNNELTPDEQDKQIEHRNKLARLYEMKAENEERTNTYVCSVEYWKNALNEYKKSLEIYEKDAEMSKSKIVKIAAIGQVKALYKLNKYKEMYKFLDEKREFHGLDSMPEYYFYLSKVHCKMNNNYTKASDLLKTALTKCSPGDYAIKHKIEEEAKLVVALGIPAKYNTYEKSWTEVNKRFETKKNYKDHKFVEHDYNILSIDGGGVRGIIPAVWLCEIEKETKMPICKMFDMMAGTSVGAIIASALALPKYNGKNVSDINKCKTNDDTDKKLNQVFLKTLKINTDEVKDERSLEPMFGAYQVLDIFRERSKDIFTSPTSNPFYYLTSIPIVGKFLYNGFKTKYTDGGRCKLFEQYFKERKLSECITDLVIPAVKNNNRVTTHLFTKYDAKQQEFYDDKILDCLMATSAAPTFFPVYNIDSKGEFIDGGVQLNNPSRTAYTEALRYGYQKEKIFVLSLGTGSSIPDPLNLDSNQHSGLLFWAKNFCDAALPSQEGNTDRQMYYDLTKERYQRWQVWFENPISLDSYDPVSLNTLMEMASQYIEELKSTDDNCFNKLIERLKRKKEIYLF